MKTDILIALIALIAGLAALGLAVYIVPRLRGMSSQAATAQRTYRPSTGYGSPLSDAEQARWRDIAAAGDDFWI